MPTGAQHVLEDVLGVPFTSGNRVEVLRNGDQVFPAILGAIGASTRSVDLLWFLWGTGNVTRAVAAALAERARAGVRVRVLLDGFGSRAMDPQQLDDLTRAGAQVAFYHPFPSWRLTTTNLRTHRRVLVCDETVGLTGGTGIDRHWDGDGRSADQWRDTAVLVRGPAVAGLRAAFASAWVQVPVPLVTGHDRFPGHEAAGDVEVQVVRAASRPGWNDAALALTGLLHVARDRVRISTPVARVPDWLMDQLCQAAERGVQVQVLVPGPHVERPSVQLQAQRGYGRLLHAGVELWVYQPSLLHAKVVTVDGHLSMVGTVNLDARSLSLNEQVALLMSHQVTTSVLDEHYEEDLALSARIVPAQWRRRGVLSRAAELAADVGGRPLRGLGAAGLTSRRP